MKMKFYTDLNPIFAEKLSLISMPLKEMHQYHYNLHNIFGEIHVIEFNQ
jgi:hypothetical protein